MKNAQLIIITLTIVLTATFFAVDTEKTHTRIYPAKVIEKLLISPTEIPVSHMGYNSNGEPLYSSGTTRTYHAFIIVSSGRCSVIPVDEKYFHRVDENSFIPVIQHTGFFTGKIIKEEVQYDLGLPSTSN